MFKLNLNYSSSVSNSAQCLINIPSVNNLDASQILNANEECKIAFGNNSLYCIVSSASA